MNENPSSSSYTKYINSNSDHILTENDGGSWRAVPGCLSLLYGVQGVGLL